MFLCVCLGLERSGLLRSTACKRVLVRVLMRVLVRAVFFFFCVFLSMLRVSLVDFPLDAFPGVASRGMLRLPAGACMRIFIFTLSVAPVGSHDELDWCKSIAPLHVSPAPLQSNPG